MSNDLISRKAAIDKFEPWLKVKGYNEGELNMLKAVLYELKCLPSVPMAKSKIPVSVKVDIENRRGVNDVRFNQQTKCD